MCLFTQTKRKEKGDSHCTVQLVQKTSVMNAEQALQRIICTSPIHASFFFLPGGGNTLAPFRQSRAALLSRSSVRYITGTDRGMQLAVGHNFVRDSPQPFEVQLLRLSVVEIQARGARPNALDSVPRSCRDASTAATLAEAKNSVSMSVGLTASQMSRTTVTGGRGDT